MNDQKRQKLPIDKDILELDSKSLRQKLMEHRADARTAMQTFHAKDNHCCWDDLVIASENLLPENERTIYSKGKFLICKREFLCQCRKFAEHLEEISVLAPDKPCSLE